MTLLDKLASKLLSAAVVLEGCAMRTDNDDTKRRLYAFAQECRDLLKDAPLSEGFGFGPLM